MKLIEFDEQTVVIAKPQYLPMPAYVDEHSPTGEIVVCWQLTWRERLQVLMRGKLWHSIWTFGGSVQPVRLTTDKPAMPTQETGANL